ncbi:hypothetical protein FISHEDRAFT_69034 [Fistulina hepatica ATCC 64428]|uniref:Crinkler effector protein N-terminal domain-containing protein n=1 Tax=Fistulina hepatica ATCC 64428 TaxID=1128425 RepID=A0A0D7ANL2_9AGAR|nr:hypothetical protein FISHEDRAFT_69034 [Fistulina hepatica ATCC 64428]
MENIFVWCLLIDHGKKPMGQIFKVKMLFDDHVSDLQLEIKKRTPSDTHEVDADELVVWRCKDQTAFVNAETSELLQEQVNKVFNNENVERLSTMQAIADVKDQTLLVMPGAFPPSSPQSSLRDLTCVLVQLQVRVHRTMQIVSEPWERDWQKSLWPLNEDLANAIFFFMLRLRLPEGRETTTQRGDASWPFELVMKCSNAPSYNQLRRHKPRSDFLVLKSTLPRLLVEVNSAASTQWPQDLIRMLLEGSAIVRFANGFVDAFKLKKNFILVAFYIRGQGEVNRFLLFQNENGHEVFYHEHTLFLNTPVGHAEFALQLYNAVHVVGEGSEEEHHDTIDKVRQFRRALEKCEAVHPVGSFYNDTQGPKTKRAGAEVEPETIVTANGMTLELLYKKPSHILTVYRPSVPCKKFTAKKVREDSNKLEVLG